VIKTDTAATCRGRGKLTYKYFA